MDVRLHLVTLDSPHYARERELRYEVLRRPLGQAPGSEVFPYEAESLHLVAFNDDGAVVGCVLFHGEGGEEEPAGRLFQMAVRDDLRGQGLGRRLVEGLEAALVQRGVKRVYLHARADVTGFYVRLGYREIGAPFVEVGIEHREMEKRLG